MSEQAEEQGKERLSRSDSAFERARKLLKCAGCADRSGLAAGMAEAVDAYRKMDQGYWKLRAVAAERVIESSPCDPDLTEEQIEAFATWREIKEEGGDA